MSNSTRYHFGWWCQKCAQVPEKRLVVIRLVPDLPTPHPRGPPELSLPELFDQQLQSILTSNDHLDWQRDVILSYQCHCVRLLQKRKL